jgi:transposase
MPIVGGLDIHRKQLTFDYLDTATGEVKRGQVAPADRAHLRAWLVRFAGREDVAFALEGCTGWRYVAEELGEAALRTGRDLQAVRASAAAYLSPAGQLQVATALEMTGALEARLEVVRHELLDAARHLTGAKVLAARLYGVGPVTALAMTCWLAGEGRFSSSRKAVRFAGLDITVYSSDSRRSPGRLSRQGPAVLRWAVYEAGKTHARSSAPDHRYYAQVKDRKDGKRAALSEARKILRQACHILAELGDDALTAA